MVVISFKHRNAKSLAQRRKNQRSGITIIELVENPYRESLITREIERLSSFSWNKSAMQQRELLETLWQRK